MNKKGYSIIELLILIIVTGIIASVLIIKSSYAFKDNSEELYKQTENLLLKAANNYAIKNPDLFKDNKVINVKVEELVKANFYPADDKEGNVVDPRNKKATLNNTEIRIKQTADSKFDVEIAK